jgi:hypothetical protein
MSGVPLLPLPERRARFKLGGGGYFATEIEDGWAGAVWLHVTSKHTYRWRYAVCPPPFTHGNLIVLGATENRHGAVSRCGRILKRLRAGHPLEWYLPEGSSDSSLEE